MMFIYKELPSINCHKYQGMLSLGSGSNSQNVVNLKLPYKINVITHCAQIVPINSAKCQIDVNSC